MDFPVTILRPNCPAIFSGGVGGGSPNPAIVGEFGLGGAATGTTVPTASRTTAAGHSILVCTGVFTSAAGTLGIATDNKSNSPYVEVVEQADGTGNVRISINHFHLAASGAGHIVNGNFSVNSFSSIDAWEVSGLLNATAEATNGNTATGTAITSGSVSATNQSLVIACFTHDGFSSESIALTAGALSAGWLELLNDPDNSTSQGMGVAYKISTGGSEQCAWTLGGSFAWAAAIASYHVA